MFIKILNKNDENLFEYANLILTSNSNLQFNTERLKDELINCNNYVILNNVTFAKLIPEIDLEGEFYIIDKSLNLIRKHYFNNFKKDNFANIANDINLYFKDFFLIKNILFIIPYKCFTERKKFFDFIKEFSSNIDSNTPFVFYPANLITFDYLKNVKSDFFFLNNSLSKDLIPLLFEGISIDCENKLSECLKKNEIDCIIDFILTSNKIICDKSYLGSFCAKNNYWNIPIDNDIEGIVYYSLPNGIRLNLSFNFKIGEEDLYIFSYVNIKSELFSKVKSSNVQNYLKHIYSYNFEVIYLNSFNSKNQF